MSSGGGVHDTVEDTRSKGWGKVAAIEEILSSVDLGDHRVEVGLLLRKAILVNSLLFTAETWSGVRKADIVRLEQWYEALLRSLSSGHSRSPREFANLEFATLRLGQILNQNRLINHHHILTQDENETIRKMYENKRQIQQKMTGFNH